MVQKYLVFGLAALVAAAGLSQVTNGPLAPQEPADADTAVTDDFVAGGDSMATGLTQSTTPPDLAGLQPSTPVNPYEPATSEPYGYTGPVYEAPADLARGTRVNDGSIQPVGSAPAQARTLPVRAGTSYTQVGGTIIGSDGTSYTQVGGTTIGSDGSSYTQVGGTTISSDGTSYTRVGGMTIGSDGTTAQRIGNSTIISGNGQSVTCTQVGSSTICN